MRHQKEGKFGEERCDYVWDRGKTSLRSLLLLRKCSAARQRSGGKSQKLCAAMKQRKGTTAEACSGSKQFAENGKKQVILF